MKYYLISGEASGDLHGSNLIKELKLLDNNSEFVAWGGDLMQQQGAKILKHYKDLAFMGLVEVIKNLPTIKKNMKFCISSIIDYKPDVLILIDYPGFNLRIAKKLKNSGIKIFYYISPTIWAWHKSRIKTIKKYINKMFVILPFEKEFYKNLNYDVDYVGNPLNDSISEYLKLQKNYTKQDFINDNNLSNLPKIAILPGSRLQEIEKMLPKMLKVANYFEDFEFIIASAPNLDYDYYNKNYKIPKNVKILLNKTYDILNFSEFAIVTSGTASLETALFKTPQIVCYYTNNLTFFIAKLLVNVKYISLVNLILNKLAVVELIQNKFTVNNLKNELNNMINNKSYIDKINDDYNFLEKIIGKNDTSRKLAELIIKYLK